MITNTPLKNSKDEPKNSNDLSCTSDSDEMSLKELIINLQDWLKYIISKWIIILIAGTIGGALGIAYSYSKKLLYTAELTFVLEGEKTGGIGSYAGLAGQLGIDLGSGGGGAFEGENLLALMKSRTMIEKALLTPVYVNGRKKTLAEFYIDIHKLRVNWIKSNSEQKDVYFLQGEDPTKFSLVKNALMNSFYGSINSKNLKIEKFDKKSNIISVKVSSENELFSKYFVEVLTEKVSEFYIQTKTKKSADNLSILQRQTDSVKRAFNYAISGVATSTDANPNPNPARQVLSISSKRQELEVQINQAILTQLVQNLEIAKISLRKETPLIQVIDKPILPLGKVGYGKLKGLVTGGMIGGFLIVLILVLRRFLNQLIQN